MDFNRNFDHIPHTSLVLLSFLDQKDCQNGESGRVFDYREDNLSTNHIDSDGDIETDGQSPPATYRDLLHELQHEVQPGLSVNAEEARAAREMAAELIRIADLLEQSVLSQAAESLTKKLRSSQEQVWASHLSKGVQTLLQHVAAAKEFKKELVEMAFTFMLMKTVCERTPDFLFGLYGTVVQFFGSN
ncbi:BH3 interacting domain death agonist isoform X1 [Danio rerio]|uniref:BH3-interacting domain death agonist n=2 Tax=Danio rerio TaxID=7955 RepID=Q1LX52_DANRE|nr:BH3 interacting domain death agonist [Danio rerio]XP_005159166.1 BH3 interacting domain death agonist isoform X1 [Danio rerio]AAI62699.1 BH3 interacting domain death agonist [Danio rerio]AAI62712.1 BH3 interacting domain death agonist [Danio rerio]|eukprot:NP_001073295.1 BH3 interacting domain death agonist [Danio rerio]